MSQENVNAHVPTSYLHFSNELNLFHAARYVGLKQMMPLLQGEPDVLYEAAGTDEIQIMIQFDLHSRELKKNKMERQKRFFKKKRKEKRRQALWEGFVYVGLHTKHSPVAELMLKWSCIKLFQGKKDIKEFCLVRF